MNFTEKEIKLIKYCCDYYYFIFKLDRMNNFLVKRCNELKNKNYFNKDDIFNLILILDFTIYEHENLAINGIAYKFQEKLKGLNSAMSNIRM